MHKKRLCSYHPLLSIFEKLNFEKTQHGSSRVSAITDRRLCITANRSLLFSAMLISTGPGSIARRVYEAMKFATLFHKQQSKVTFKTINLKMIC